MGYKCLCGLGAMLLAQHQVFQRMEMRPGICSTLRKSPGNPLGQPVICRIDTTFALLGCVVMSDHIHLYNSC